MSSLVTVADLTDEHLGFYMQIELTPNPDDLFPRFHRCIELGEIRRWEYQGEQRTGLLDLSSKAPGIRGTEFQFKADAKVTLIRRVSKPRRKKETTK
ncbi:hypothetical protein [Arthrobacter sp. D5-1]|uniref:hypothetical protein n=1 Tax=Arthrobacter sp. D5-1 TaxID=1477518 RepID=UPI001A9A2832|nr:hypothetical protein [Arthrobacter sp. D5-1]